MLTWSMSLSLSLFVFTGCAAAYTPPPLTTQHPAHPEAMVAPEPPRSHTLAYVSSDRPATQPGIAMAQAQQSARPAAQQGQQIVIGEGTWCQDTFPKVASNLSFT